MLLKKKKTYLILILLVVCLFPLMKVKLPTILIYTILSRVLDGPGTIVGPSLSNTPMSTLS